MKKVLSDHREISICFGLMHVVLTAAFIWLGRADYALGSDGGTYGDMVLRFDAWISQRMFEAQHVVKVVPIAITYGIIKLADWPMTVASIIQSYRLLNLGSLLVYCWVGSLVARELGLGRGATFVFFVFLNINFATLSFNYYFPDHIDTFVLMLGMVMFYFYLRERYWLLFLTVVISAFSRQTMIIEGALLLAFPRSLPVPQLLSAGMKWRPETIVIAAAFAALSIYAELKPIAFVTTFPPLFQWGRWPGQVAEFLMLAAGLGWLSAGVRFDAGILRSRYIVPAVLVFLAAKLGVAIFIEHFGNPGGKYTVDHLLNTALLGSNAPFLGLVSHFAYVGLLVPLLVVAWPNIASHVRSLGLGALGVVAFGVIHGVNPETRLLIELLPVMAAVGAFAIKEVRGCWHHVALLGAAALMSSKFWAPLFEQDHWVGHWSEFPKQWYYMNIGPWMASTAYIAHLSFLIAAIIAWRIFLHRNSTVAIQAVIPSHDQ